MFKNLLKAAVGIVTLPVDVVADVVTMGGVLKDKDKPYTASKLEDIVENIDRSIDPDRD